MANRKTEKIEIDDKKLLDIIKNHGYSLNQLAKKIEWSDKSIRNAIVHGQITEELLSAISYGLDCDLSEVRIDPSLTDKKINANIKTLSGIFGLTTEELAKKIRVSREQLSDVISGKISATT